MTAARLCQTSRSATALAVSAVVVAGCSTDAPSPDRLELATVENRYLIPKSTPNQLLSGFDRFCVNGAEDLARQDKDLRDAGYVPITSRRPDRNRVYVIDNRQPAIGVSETMCVARATARTGQTQVVQNYVADTFPEARPLSTSGFAVDVEQAWAVDGGILATARNRWIGNRSSYSVIYFTPSDTTPQAQSF